MTQEQHGFELYRPILHGGFLLKNTVSFSRLQVSHPWILPPADQILVIFSHSQPRIPGTEQHNVKMCGMLLPKTDFRRKSPVVIDFFCVLPIDSYSFSSALKPHHSFFLDNRSCPIHLEPLPCSVPLSCLFFFLSCLPGSFSDARLKYDSRSTICRP